MGTRQTLGEFEELALRAILLLGAEAYGVLIRRALEEKAGRVVSVGHLYTTLDRLEEKGFIEGREVEVAGRTRRYYDVKNAGRDAVVEAERARVSLGPVIPATCAGRTKC